MASMVDAVKTLLSHQSCETNRRGESAGRQRRESLSIQGILLTFKSQLLPASADQGHALCTEALTQNPKSRMNLLKLGWKQLQILHSLITVLYALDSLRVNDTVLIGHQRGEMQAIRLDVPTPIL